MSHTFAQIISIKKVASYGFYSVLSILLALSTSFVVSVASEKPTPPSSANEIDEVLGDTHTTDSLQTVSTSESSSQSATTDNDTTQPSQSLETDQSSSSSQKTSIHYQSTTTVSDPETTNEEDPVVETNRQLTINGNNIPIDDDNVRTTLRDEDSRTRVRVRDRSDENSGDSSVSISIKSEN